MVHSTLPEIDNKSNLFSGQLRISYAGTQFFFLRFRVLGSIIIPMLSRRIGLSQYKNLIAKADTISEQNRYTGLDTLIVGNTILTAHSSR